MLESRNNDYLLREEGLECLIRCLSDIPAYLFTRDVFEQLVGLAKKPNPQAGMQAYVNRLLNGQQNTHTASVHESVSASATKLWGRYEQKLSGDGLKAIITKIKSDVAGLSDSLENQAAKDCIKRVSADNYDYIDPTSRVTTKQLLALSYLAINAGEYCEVGDLSGLQQEISGSSGYHAYCHSQLTNSMRFFPMKAPIENNHAEVQQTSEQMSL